MTLGHLTGYRGRDEPQRPTLSRGTIDPFVATGTLRPGGKLDRFMAGRNTRNQPIFEDGLVYVSVEDQYPRRAVLSARDFLRITARDPRGPWLTRTRWWLDEANLLRAFSLHERPMEHGVLVAAAILGAREGDAIDVPGDPLDVRRSRLKKVSVA
jgi:hypothetical protein